MASRRVRRGPEGGRFRVASVATQSWWRSHGTRPMVRWGACSSQLAVGAATVCQRPTHPSRGSPLYEDPAEVRSSDRPCALDMCNTARSFTHESNTCVIRRWVFLILGCIDLLSCIRSLPPSFRPSLGGLQGLGTALERRRCKKNSRRYFRFNTLRFI